MRQIDADELITLIEKDKIPSDMMNIMTILGNENEAKTLNQACDRHIQIIQNQPTLYPKQGEWIEHIGYYECTACGYCVGTNYRYCPNCGLSMKEG